MFTFTCISVTSPCVLGPRFVPIFMTGVHIQAAGKVHIYSTEVVRSRRHAHATDIRLVNSVNASAHHESASLSSSVVRECPLRSGGIGSIQGRDIP